jgi:DNA repair photolyase
MNNSSENESADSKPRDRMNGKPVLWRENTRTIITDPSPAFRDKLLCDNLVFNLGDACAFSCQYCYVEGMVYKIVKPSIDRHNYRKGGIPLVFPDVVVRRKNTLGILKSQLIREDGTDFYNDPSDFRVIYSSSLVDPAANMELLRETADACKLILDHTRWQIRLLSKSNLLASIVNFIPERYHTRLILGFSTGTLDDSVSRAIEKGTAIVSKRIQALHWLQDRGFRTFGMICPSLPQLDYNKFSKEMCAALRAERCEHVWGEAINVRGDSLPACINALKNNGLDDEAERLIAVHGPGSKAAWEEYARATFLAHTTHVPGGKLRFLQYVSADSAQWWGDQRKNGAVPLGKAAHVFGVGVKGRSAPDIFYKREEDLF